MLDAKIVLMMSPLIAPVSTPRVEVIVTRSRSILHFGYFQAPAGIYGSGGDFAGYEIVNPEVSARAEVAIDDILPWLKIRETV